MTAHPDAHQTDASSTSTFVVSVSSRVATLLAGNGRNDPTGVAEND
jgi:hypothetical protein